MPVDCNAVFSADASDALHRYDCFVVMTTASQSASVECLVAFVSTHFVHCLLYWHTITFILIFISVFQLTVQKFVFLMFGFDIHS